MENKTPKSKTGSAIPYLALILSLIALAGLLFTYWQFSKGFVNLNQTMHVTTEQEEVTNQQLRNDLIITQKQNKILEASLTNLQEMSKGNVAVWRFSEAKYLVQLAYYHLTFTRDIPAALALLQTAEQRIGTINDPALLPIRQLLANNIAALQAVPKVDLASLLTRITALQMQVTNLPTIGLPTTKPMEQVVEGEKSPSPLRKAMSDSWVTLQKIVVIRNQDQPIQPLLSPEQQAYLHQNLQLILQQAQWAALRGQKDIYQTSLLQAQKWVENYFARNLPATQAFLQAIADLQKVNVQPDLPNLAPMARKIQEFAFLPSNKQAA